VEQKKSRGIGDPAARKLGLPAKPDLSTEIADSPQPGDLTGRRRFGAWSFVQFSDSSQKRALVICDCGSHAVVALGALMAGDSTGCGGCRGTPRSSPVASPRRNAFAAEIGGLERQSARQRHRGGGP
jgi:hypothetical protein